MKGQYMREVSFMLLLLLLHLLFLFLVQFVKILLSFENAVVYTFILLVIEVEVKEDVFFA